MSSDKRKQIVQRLSDDFESMSEPQQLSLIRAIRGASKFFRGDGFEVFTGEMLVAATKSSMNKRMEERLVLGMNFMKWLTKFYFTDVTSGFRQVYRSHSIPARILKSKVYKDSDLDLDNLEGTVQQFTPHKPILSWTDLKDPYVADRDDAPDDKVFILSTLVSKQDVIWSYKIVNWRPYLKAAAALARKKNKKAPRLSKKTNATGLELELHTRLREGGSRSLLETFLKELYDLSGDMVKEEQEVTVFHGKAKFKALVVSVT